MARKRNLGVVIMVMAALLLSVNTLHAADKRIPREVFGVVLGSTDIDDAEASLRAKGWKPDVDCGDEEDDNQLYLFIFGEDKPVNFMGYEWALGMYITGEQNTHTIEDFYVVSSFVPLRQSRNDFRKLSKTLRQQYPNSILQDESDNLLILQGESFISLTLKGKNGDDQQGRLVMIIHIGDDSASSTSEADEPAQPEVSLSSSSSIVFGATLPHSLLGIEVGETKRSKAKKTLEKQGFSPEIKGEKQYISVSTKNRGFTLLGHEITLVNIYFDDKNTKTCSEIYCGIVFNDGTEAREFIRTISEALVAKYPDCVLVDEQNNLVLKQNGYYLSVMREYASDTWIAIVTLSNKYSD